MPACPVCNEPFGSTVIPVSLPCGHIFWEDKVDESQGQPDIRSFPFQYGANASCSGVSGHEPIVYPHADSEQANYEQWRVTPLPDSEAETLQDDAHFWAETLESISDHRVKSALALLFQSPDLANLRRPLTRARSEQHPLRNLLEDALLAVNASYEENVRLSSQLRDATENLRLTKINLCQAVSTAISNTERLATLENLKNQPQETLCTCRPKYTFQTDYIFHRLMFSAGNLNAQSDALNHSRTTILQRYLLNLPDPWERNSHKEISFGRYRAIKLLNKALGILCVVILHGKIGDVIQKLLEIVGYIICHLILPILFYSIYII
ncbi:hypothetical protein BD410DRAFT_786637 [Rickenella mellea]|uniref:RING-type domain-containing protein n=1 Tax=Rickenella mellea TaxID=50990 RepID=A0A4Y7QAQ8_9AGAM|nr:hypothetical protein BD410DRAFT_786637 [Rickenella mellea]